MKISVLLPKVAHPMTDARLVGWIAIDGASVAEGEALFSIDQDASIQKIVASRAGRLKILASAGERYPVGHVLGYIDTACWPVAYNFPPRLQLDD